MGLSGVKKARNVKTDRKSGLCLSGFMMGNNQAFCCVNTLAG